MPEYQVPQFIEHETKIVGPLTFRQFIYVGGGSVILFILFFTIGEKNFFLFFIIAALTGGFALALAFVKVGGRSFGSTLFSMIGFFSSPRIFIWQKTRGKIPIIPPLPAPSSPPEKELEKSPLTFAERSRLKSLSWKVDTHMENEKK